MSLAIKTHLVREVLLVDGWHSVIEGTFDLDAYEFLSEEGLLLVGGGTNTNVSATGASWLEKDSQCVCCPLSAILAVKVGDKINQ